MIRCTLISTKLFWENAKRGNIIGNNGLEWLPCLFEQKILVPRAKHFNSKMSFLLFWPSLLLAENSFGLLNRKFRQSRCLLHFSAFYKAFHFVTVWHLRENWKGLNKSWQLTPFLALSKPVKCLYYTSIGS